MYNLIQLIKSLNIIAFIFLIIMLAVSSVSNIEINYGIEIFIYSAILQSVLVFIEDFFIEKDPWIELSKISNRKDSHKKLSFMGFKWNSVFNH